MFRFVRQQYKTCPAGDISKTKWIERKLHKTRSIPAQFTHPNIALFTPRLQLHMSVLHKWRAWGGAGAMGACAFRYSHATSTGATIVGTIEELDTQEARSRAAPPDPPPCPFDPDSAPTSSLDFISAQPSRATDLRSHLPPLRRHRTPPDLRSSLTLSLSFLLGPSLFSLFLPKKLAGSFRWGQGGEGDDGDGSWQGGSLCAVSTSARPPTFGISTTFQASQRYYYRLEAGMGTAVARVIA